MPSDEIPELGSENITRIVNKALTARSFKGRSQPDTQPLINEVNSDFAKTMNKIIFDKHMKGKGKELIGGNLILPPKKKAICPYYGMIGIPQYSFPERFAEFCYASVLTRMEAIKADERINLECLEAAEKEVFNTNLMKTLKLEEFKQIEVSSISQCSYYLRETWVSKIKDIIKEKFKESGDLMNLEESNYDLYLKGKLKKFLTLAKIRMQETVIELFDKSYKKFVKTILKFIPERINVISVSEIENAYSEYQADDAGHNPIPLFSIELAAIGKPEEMPVFSYEPKKLIDIMMWLYDKGIDDLQNISQVEPKVMTKFFKAMLKTNLRVPFRPNKKGAIINAEKKELEDNAWLDENYEKLKSEITRAVIPLEAYRALFAHYKDEFLLSVEEEKKKFEDQENPISAQELKKAINKHREMEKILAREIPKTLQVSCFLVDCSEMGMKLRSKHVELATEGKKTLREKARAITSGIIEAFDAMRNKIKKLPTTIEELTNLRNYISSDIPNLVEKQKIEIDKMMEAYDILDEYMEKLNREENQNKWAAFRKPKELNELIEEQKAVLLKKEETLFGSMQAQQAEFKEELVKIEEIVANMKNFTDINNYEEVARKAQTLREKLKECKEKEKGFNLRESLLNKPLTDYGQLRQIEKDFLPYDNLWTTTEKWFRSKHSWHNDPWEKLDAPAMDNLVQESSKILSQTIRAFKEMPAILKIAEQVKLEVENFKVYVPLVLALRTEGMKERHWDEISQLVKFEVRPKEGFTMTTVENMNLLNYLPDIEKAAEK